MKELDIAHALTDLSDGLLLEADRTETRRRPMKFRRIAAVAAIIAMLAVTVAAATVGISWTVDREHGEDVIQKYGAIALDYYKDYDGTQSFDKLEYSIPLQTVTLPDQKLQQLRDILYRHWNLTQTAGYAYSYDIGPDAEFVFDSMDSDGYIQHFINVYGASQTMVPGLRTLEDVEELLGIELSVPEALREAIRQESRKDAPYTLCLRIYTGTTISQAAKQAGILEPTLAVVNWQLDGYCRNGCVYGRISIPLTEAAAQAGLQGLHYSYESEGAIWQEEQTLDGRDLIFFGNAPEAGYDGWAEAVYIADGIGYCVSARRDADIPHYSPPWPSYDSAKDMVLSLLTGAG